MMSTPQVGLTVMSANLWHDWPRQHRWAPRLQAVADLASGHGVDVLLLQEVARTRTLQADGWLARRLGMSHGYARANGSARAFGFEEGLAILSRYPIIEVRTRRLTRNPAVRRIGLGAALDTPFGRVTAVCVHLGLVHSRQAHQMRVLRTWLDEMSGSEPAIIGGDFNATPAHRGISALRREWVDTFQHARPNQESTTHRRRSARLGVRERLIDYVFVRQPAGAPWTVVDAAHVDGPSGGHSDHRAVIAQLVPGSYTPG